jgi:cytochrome c peroxidase
MLPELLLSIVIPLGLDLYMPVPPTNPLTVEKIDRGRQLFFDRRLSRDATIACASCHRPERAFSDGRAIAIGIGGRTGRRNAPALINRGYGKLFFWDGREHSLEEQVIQPIEDPNEMGSSAEEAARRVGLSVDDLAHALASYVRSILSGNSRFDRFVSGDRMALSDQEQRGLQLFRGRGNCTACHVGPNFSDEELHNTGVAWNPDASELKDPGAQHGEFKTPTLREVVRSAPYMHDGSLATLEEVVDFYSNGGRANPYLDPELRPLRLDADENRALVAFLTSLAAEQLPGAAGLPR